MFCKYCGKEIKNDAQFCPYCGGKQGHEAAEPIARKASPGPGQMTEVIDFGEEQFEEVVESGRSSRSLWRYSW